MPSRRIKNKYAIFLTNGSDEREITLQRSLNHTVTVSTESISDIGQAAASWESAQALAKGWTANVNGVLAYDFDGNYYTYYDLMAWLKGNTTLGFKLVETAEVGGVITPAPNGYYITGNCKVQTVSMAAEVKKLFTFSVKLRGKGKVFTVDSGVFGAFDYTLDFGLN